MFSHTYAWKEAARKAGHAVGKQPAKGSVLFLPRQPNTPDGVVVLVEKLINSHRVLIDQANWTRRGEIYRGVAVEDVSEKEDWSLVILDGEILQTGGFILPKR